MNKYLYIINGEQHGPLAKADLISAGVKSETLVWCVGMAAWTPACKVEELSGLFGSVPPPPPPIPPTEEYKSVKPDDYLIWAIVAILCCFPLGVVSVIYSTYVDSRYKKGDYDGAEEASEKAKKWAVAAMLVAVVIYAFAIFKVIVVFNGIAAIMSSLMI